MLPSLTSFSNLALSARSWFNCESVNVFFFRSFKTDQYTLAAIFYLKLSYNVTSYKPDCLKDNSKKIVNEKYFCVSCEISQTTDNRWNRLEDLQKSYYTKRWNSFGSYLLKCNQTNMISHQTTCTMSCFRKSPLDGSQPPATRAVARGRVRH